MKAFAYVSPSTRNSAALISELASLDAAHQGQRYAESLGLWSAQHAECIRVAHIVPKIDHRLQAMLFDHSADAFSLIGKHWQEQLKRELSAAVAQTMRFGDMAHANRHRLVSS
jgi:hypothetical protein